MNRRQFLTSAVSVGVSAALPASPKRTLGPPCFPEIVDKSPAQAYIEHMMRRVVETMEYKRAEFDLIAYGQSVFDPAKAIAEIEALDSRREPWHDPKAGDVPVQE